MERKTKGHEGQCLPVFMKKKLWGDDGRGATTQFEDISKQKTGIVHSTARVAEIVQDHLLLQNSVGVGAE